MSSRRAAWLLLLLLFACSRERRRFNVLLITLDTTRADHISSGVTPNLERLAARGVRFAQASSTAPLTLPSHTSILTGRLPRSHGLHLNGAGALKGDVATLATAFQSAGYRTGAFVGSFVLDHRFGLARGFDTYDDNVTRDPGTGVASLESERSASSVIDAAIAWLQPSRPFFAWVHLYDPHLPYTPPEPFRSQHPGSPYDGELAYTDAQVARLLATIDVSQTIVVVVGDHGEGLGDHGEAAHGLLLYESTLHVPLIIASPDLKPQVVDAPVSSVDIAPTILSLAGLRPFTGVDGLDLSDDLRERRAPQAHDVFAETHYPVAFGWSDLAAVRRGNAKLIAGKREELFDVAADPRETINRRSDERRSAGELSAVLARHRTSPQSTQVIDAETRSRLQSLGYIAPAAGVPGQDAADPRDMIAAFSEFEAATASLNAGNAKDAAARLEKLVVSSPRNRVFRSMLARTLSSLGNNAGALKFYREAVALSPGDADAWYDLAAALQESGDLRETRTAIDEALRLDPSRVEGYNMLGIALVRGGDAAAAMNAFRRAVSIDPLNARAWNNLGNVARDGGNATEALDAYRRAVALAPRYADPLNGIGVIQVSSGQSREAIATFDRCLAIAPDMYEAKLNRAIALAVSGRRSEAVSELRALLSNRAAISQHAAAKELLSRL